MEALWFAILAFVFLIYVVADGFALGAGILHFFAKDEEYRSICRNGILGVWHANQTWIVVFGGSLFGAFPLVYGVVLSSLYVPVGLLLFGYVLRGVGLEYHENAVNKSRPALAFGLGSLIATMAQGLGVGAYLMGLPVEGRSFAGGFWHFISPFSVLLMVGLPVFYALLGATRLMGKTEGRYFELSRAAARTTGFPALAAAVVVVVWLLIVRPVWTVGWFTWPGFLYTLLPIVLGAAAFGPLLRSVLKAETGAPFYWTALMMGLIGIGIMAGLPPVIIPPDVTLAQAAAPRNVLVVMAVTALIFTPVILIYSVYMYRVFRGKIEPGEYGDEGADAAGERS